MLEKKKADRTGGISSEEFIAKAPLFVKFTVDAFSPPNAITFDCDSPGCVRGGTWYRVHHPSALGYTPSGRGTDVADGSLKSVAYKCFKCGESALTVVYREMRTEKRPVNRGRAPAPPIDLGSPPPPPPLIDVVVEVIKVGQYPRPSIEIPPALEKNLGKESADCYKRALICRNTGFGLAATGYMRRVVEDKTNELIEIVANHAELNGIDPATVAKIRKAADSSAGYTPYDQKLELAGGVFPDSLMVGNINPLQKLYSLVSEGIHGKSEEQCVEIASNTDAVFQYLFTNLKAQTDTRREFMEKLKRL
jgi:hypothetical protein